MIPYQSLTAQGAKIEELAKLLNEEDGFEYSDGTLRNLRDVAHLYPAARRRAAVSFAIHTEARDPDFLDEIIELFKNENRKLTVAAWGGGVV